MRRMVVIAVVTAAIAGAGASARAVAHPLSARSVDRTALIERVNVAASEFKFVLSEKSAKRGVVIFKVKNAGKIAHDFQIKGRKTRLLQPGQSATLRVTFLKKGVYPYKCTVPGHAQAGMKGVFKIT